MRRWTTDATTPTATGRAALDAPLPARRLREPWITVWHDEVTRPDGAPGHLRRRPFRQPGGRRASRSTTQDRVLLVGQHRYTLDAYSWEIPEGGVPGGETALDGARRELLEETGVEAAELARAGAPPPLELSVSDELAVLFLATGLSHGDATPDGTSS